MHQIQASWFRYRFEFREPGHTSRGILRFKDSWFLVLRDTAGLRGLGEWSVLPGLSPGTVEEWEDLLTEECEYFNQHGFFPEITGARRNKLLLHHPGFLFARDMVTLGLDTGNPFLLWPEAREFTAGQKKIPINGLIWMGDVGTMAGRLEKKIGAGCSCVKLKIGALDFQAELDFLAGVRARFRPDQLEIRLDANGAFTADNAVDRLERLAEFQIHSLEQPIAAGQPEAMARICRESPIPIALDEELIFANRHEYTPQFITREIHPAYLILKPGLLGDFQASREWIDAATDQGIGWWVTSALEGSPGLNALAQYCVQLETRMVQGLGTGSVFKNNISSPLECDERYLYYDPEREWARDTFLRPSTNAVP